MAVLFEQAQVGNLVLRNRMVRSATAECMALANGEPKPVLAELYRDLAIGGVGLIITGHMYIHRTGKAHPEMTGIYDDRLLPELSHLADTAHAVGGRIAVQINHAGRQTRDPSIADPIAPSAVEAKAGSSGARAMTVDEIEAVIEAYAQAARRAQEAGFDAVQIHGAHGYLVSQFLSPLANQRTDEWGGSLENRIRFVDRVTRAVRDAVGADFPIMIKLGIRDQAEDGLTLEEGLHVVRCLADASIDAIEISGGVSSTRGFNIPTAIAPGKNEAYFRPWAKEVQAVTDVPIMLVGGFRSLEMMDDVLESGDAQFISICRPLICEPDLPALLERGTKIASSCVSGNRCGGEKPGDGIACKCAGVTR